MSKFTSPLDNIRIASPCSANWEGMFGSDRKRFCGDCRLNVYNLSDMSRQEAENLILSSEGLLCVRFFRRADGTILTKNCPVGWAAVKQRASRVATAVFSMIAGLFTGVLGFNMLNTKPEPRHQIMGAMTIPSNTAVPYYRTVPYNQDIDDFDGPEMGNVAVGRLAVTPESSRQKFKTR